MKNVGKNLEFIAPNKADFILVRQYIDEFKLDDNDLDINQFIVVKENECMLGFGRIKNNEGYAELSSLGVLNFQRNRGIGKALVKYFLAMTHPMPLYLVTIIPTYFEKLGFEIVEVYPPSINKKIESCLIRCHSTKADAKAMKYIA